MGDSAFAATSSRVESSSRSGGGMRSERDMERNDNDRSRYNGGGGRYRDRSRDRNRERRDDRYRDADRERERDRDDRYRRRSRSRDRYRDDRYRRDYGRRRDDHRDRRDDSRRYREREKPNREERRRSVSPKEPENFDNVAAIDERKRANPQWDVKPRGFDSVTNEMAKMSGLFPTPGHPKPVDIEKLASLVNEDGTLKSSEEAGSATVAALIQNTDPDALKPERSRVARRAFVTGFDPLKVLRRDLVDFFVALIRDIKLHEDNKGVIVNTSRETSENTVFQVDFGTSELATLAVAFNGFLLDSANPSLGAVEVDRPSDYVVPVPPDYPKGVVSSHVYDGPNKLVVANIPLFVTSEQVTELLGAFGQMDAFELVQDQQGGSKGVAFVQYTDGEVTEAVLQGLNGTDLGGSNLRVFRACEGLQQSKHLISMLPCENGVQLKQLGEVANHEATKQQTNVLQFLNMVTNEELADDNMYERIKQDIESECKTYGPVSEIFIPRPNPGTVGRLTLSITLQNAGVGKIFVKFEKPEAARAALEALHGRRYADRTVVVAYYPQRNFELGVF